MCVGGGGEYVIRRVVMDVRRRQKRGKQRDHNSMKRKLLEAGKGQKTRLSLRVSRVNAVLQIP